MFRLCGKVLGYNKIEEAEFWISW